MTTDPSTVDFHASVGAAAMKHIPSLLKKRAHAEAINSAVNGRTAQSVRIPCGRSSKLPGRAGPCNFTGRRVSLVLPFFPAKLRRIKQGGNELSRARSSKWQVMTRERLLAETLGEGPAVVALGRQLRNLTPITLFLRRVLPLAIQAAVAKSLQK
ncbi:hypothetical protein [Candidatus Mycobacterium methanotrophicum]|uniref:Uncharacterized protein n=1 Tax=Candidatus Mycobacterium methanotrophicum TaxID=2943498 RepID=A0ABY4QJY9_9MYCO|nr:hypothetical protein [Candidatus Mycobacterium methanotrophicum]UQX10643.1 hypothetical protein M5I08_21920 [Candidatus Mycobacterium methanotrophicum]